jgi:CheY-like chemotaxis protein
VVADPQAAAFCSSMIAMGQQLGITVVADGVTDEAQCDLLRRHMCDQIQGSFFAAPMPPAALDTWLADLPALPAHLRRLHKPTRRLLLVDDEPNILAALKRLLRGDGYQISTAGDGPQGLAVLASQQIDVIVSDQRMPGMLGADFLRKAREIAPESIRIMLSGYTELQSVTDAVNEGAIYKFLSKPWDDEQLRAHIADAFSVKQNADDIQRLHLEVRSANQELAAANRRMEQMLEEKQRQIHRDEISLNVAHEVLQHLPLPVLGMDDTGMIAFANQAAQTLLHHSGALLGEPAAGVLPELGAAVPPHGLVVRIAGRCYAMQVYPMGSASDSRGSLVTLSATDEAAP